jgi:hypothetical protein
LGHRRPLVPRQPGGLAWPGWNRRRIRTPSSHFKEPLSEIGGPAVKGVLGFMPPTVAPRGNLYLEAALVIAPRSAAAHRPRGRQWWYSGSPKKTSASKSGASMSWMHDDASPSSVYTTACKSVQGSHLILYRNGNPF